MYRERLKSLLSGILVAALLTTTGAYAVEPNMVEAAKKEGKLLDAADNYILIEEQKGQGKKKELVQQTISLDEIKTTKIQIKW